MKVLTIKQPWATLIAKGYKEYEFRTWKTKYRGDILIHAGKSIDKKAMSRFEEYNLDYPQSRIIAEVEIVDCIKVDKEFNEMINKLNSPVYGSKERTGYAWKLDNIKKMNIDMTITGKHGIWYIDLDNLN